MLLLKEHLCYIIFSDVLLYLSLSLRVFTLMILILLGKKGKGYRDNQCLVFLSWSNVMSVVNNFPSYVLGALINLLKQPSYLVFFSLVLSWIWRILLHNLICSLYIVEYLLTFSTSSLSSSFRFAEVVLRYF